MRGKNALSYLFEWTLSGMYSTKTNIFVKNDDLESGEELEDGEISDEDEDLKNERNEPKAVCRFYNRGHCTWGTSCRYLGFFKDLFIV